MTRSNNNKSRRKTKADLGSRMSLAAEMMMDPLSLSSAVGAIYASMFTDASNELVQRNLLISEVDDEVLETSAVLAPPAHAQPALASTVIEDGANRWIGLRLPCNDGSFAKLDAGAWNLQDDASKASISELLDGLALAARLAGSQSDDQVFQRLLPPMLPPTTQSSIANKIPLGGEASADDVYVNELNKILPQNLKNSQLFMGIINEISSQLRTSGLISKIEEEIAADMPEVKDKPSAAMTEERLAELIDDDLPDLDSLPSEIREKIEAETSKASSSAKQASQPRINPMFMMKLSQSLLGGENNEKGSDIANNLKSIAEKISMNLKSQVESQNIDPNLIKADLTNALSFLSTVGLAGPSVLQPEKVD